MSASLRRFRKYLFTVLLTLSSVIIALDASADLKVDFSSSGGYTENLLSDSSAIEDSYSTIRASINYYPFSKLELNINNGYTYYGKTSDLSNFVGGVGLRFIPTAANSRFSLLVNGAFSSQAYRDSYSQFNTDNYDFGLALGYRLFSRLQFRSGVSYNSLIYTNYVGADKKTFKLFAGFNTTLPGNFSLDLESGYATMGYKRIRESIRFIYIYNPFTPIDSSWTDDRLKSFYISPRLSRQLGAKTGVSVMYTYRDFSNFDGRVVWGIATGFISPWASIYDGQAVSATVKTYLLPHFITSFGAGYWDKTFFTTAENGTYIRGRAKPRRDFQSRYYFSLQRPIVFRSGLILEPNLQLEYGDNRSTHGLYNYNLTAITFGLNIRL
ncbi:MAG: hypothetical protein HRF51_08835 [bacterium]|jgi:hypothetical protein